MSRLSLCWSIAWYTNKTLIANLNNAGLYTRLLKWIELLDGVGIQ